LSVPGVVAALGAEARTLGSLAARSDRLWSSGDGVLVAVSGMGYAAAAAAARALVASGAGGLVSWGLAGGLDPALDAGTICLPTAILARNGTSVPTTDQWRERIRLSIASACQVVGGSLLTSGVAIGDAVAKACAFRDTGAVAVDMESLAVAEVAVVHGLPFVTVRAIVDTAGDDLPMAVMDASRDGPLRLSVLMRGLLRSPLEALPLLSLGRRYRKATRALVAAARSGALAADRNGAPAAHR
jgi:adenosylhomocysteine nucleosidase